MEVFIPFDGKEEAIPFLEASLKAWDKVKFAIPQVIELQPGNKMDVQFRVAADGLAKGEFYVLADIDAVPEEPYLVSQIQNHLKCTGADLGMAMLRPIFKHSGRVRVVRKKGVQKWPPPESENYDKEHAQALVSAGYKYEIWNDVNYRYLKPLIIH